MVAVFRFFSLPSELCWRNQTNLLFLFASHYNSQSFSLSKLPTKVKHSIGTSPTNVEYLSYLYTPVTCLSNMEASSRLSLW